MDKQWHLQKDNLVQRLYCRPSASLYTPCNRQGNAYHVTSGNRNWSPKNMGNGFIFITLQEKGQGGAPQRSLDQTLSTDVLSQTISKTQENDNLQRFLFSFLINSAEFPQISLCSNSFPLQALWS